MVNKTGIEWTDATWNPVRGCSRVSDGCRHCYAESYAYRFSGLGQPYEGLVRIGADGERKPEWNGTIQFVEKHLLDPLRWKEPRRIFVNSMSDLFHPEVTYEMLDRIFAVMALCPQHTFQVLTKRPERMLAVLSDETFESMVLAEAHVIAVARGIAEHEVPSWPLPNVWLGVSVGDQRAADARIPLLLQTPAAKRFVSLEPLLGPIDLTNVMDRSRSRALKRNCIEAKEANDAHEYLVATLGVDYPYTRLDWVIVGGESGKGPGIRPMHPDWVRGLRDQCVAAGVPFFFKQWGIAVPGDRLVGGEDAYPGSCCLHFDGTVDPADCCSYTYEETTPADRAVRMHRRTKKAAGDLLDGVQWHQMPEVRSCEAS